MQLQLGRNRIGNEGVRHLGEALKYNKVILNRSIELLSFSFLYRHLHYLILRVIESKMNPCVISVKDCNIIQ